MMASYTLEGIIETALSDTEDGRWLRRHADFFIIPFVDKDGVEDGDQGKNRKPHDHNRDYIRRIHPTVRAITEQVSLWQEDKPLFFMDMHCPWLRGGDDPSDVEKGTNEYIYFVGSANEVFWKKLQRFSLILERERKGALPYKASNNLPFGVAWNTPANKKGANQQMSWEWAQSLPNVVFGATIEIPFANAEGAVVDANSARALGYDLARAMRVYLESKED
jgi:hypothetical protein